MQTKVHFDILDSLRGIAAVLVCLFHFTHGHMPKLTNDITSAVFLEGGVGVYIFFVISGFVIPFVLHKVKYQLSGREFKKFMLKRLIRIWPPSLISILVLVLFWLGIDLFFSSTFKYMSLFSIGVLITNLLYVAPFFDHGWFNGVFWTLSVELQYYIFVALFYNLIFKNTTSLIVSTFLFCLPLFFYSPVLQMPEELVSRHIFFLYYPFFALGFLTLQFKLGQIPKVLFYAMLSIIGVIVFFQFNPIVAFMSVVTSLVIIYLENKNVLLTFLGRISFSLYLTHMVSGAAFEGVITKLISVNSDIMKISLQFFAFIFSIGCAYLFYILVERPSIYLSNFIIKRESKGISFQTTK